jgi:NAD(P)H-dependent FMN reductase
MRTLLVVWHSTTGGTRAMAEAAAAPGAEGVTVRLLHADAVQPADVLGADGFVFATPEMLGSMAGAMKSCFERCYYPALDRLAGRAYALLVCAGSDGSGAVRQVQRIATGWRLREAAPPIIVCTQAQTPDAIAAPKIIAPEDLARCAELGAAMAEGLALGVF